MDRSRNHDKRTIGLSRNCRAFRDLDFYYHTKRMHAPDKYEDVKAEIVAIYHENKGRYGYHRVTLELGNRKVSLNHKIV